MDTSVRVSIRTSTSTDSWTDNHICNRNISADTMISMIVVLVVLWYWGAFILHYPSIASPLTLSTSVVASQLVFN